LDIIDENSLIQKRFYRETCKKFNGGFIKDLKYMRFLSDETDMMVLVDDNSDSISHNMPHAVKIRAFEGDQSD
jgi:hypothetical protein